MPGESTQTFGDHKRAIQEDTRAFDCPFQDQSSLGWIEQKARTSRPSAAPWRARDRWFIQRIVVRAKHDTQPDIAKPDYSGASDNMRNRT